MGGEIQKLASTFSNQNAYDAEMVFKFLFVGVNGWIVWTLKSDGCEAKDAKVRGSYTS